MRLNHQGRKKVDNTYAVVKFLNEFLEKNPHEADKECMWSICLDQKNQVIQIDLVYIGTVNGMMVRTTELFRCATECGASKLIIAHNHPSGILEFSEDDLKTKKRLADAGSILDIQLIDFISFTRDNRWLSAMVKK